MIPVAPTWAFLGAAIDALDDTHLAAGGHVRFQPSQRIGLPSTPLFVRRRLLPNPVNYSSCRTDIFWYDSKGQQKFAPFTVTPDNPVHGYLPEPTCSWIEVSAPVGGLTVEACVKNWRGPASIATRRTPRYVLSGQRIDLLRISGSGTVTTSALYPSGVRWIDVTPLLAGATAWRTLGMPIEPLIRYAPVQPYATAVSQALARVDAGAPKKRSLIQDPTIATPAAAPASSVADEHSRVLFLGPSLDTKVRELMTTATKPQRELFQPISQIGGLHASSNGSARLPYLGRVLQSLADPGMARYLGFADIDAEVAEAPVTPPTHPNAMYHGSLIIYQAIAGWQIAESMLGSFYDPFVTLTSELTIPDFVAEVPEAGVHPFGSVTRVWPLSGLAVLTVGIPPDRPARPIPDATVDRGWRADFPPPTVLRTVGLPVKGLDPAASVSLARATGVTWESQNPTHPSNGAYRLPLVPGVVKTKKPADGIGRGYFVDHEAPPGATSYRLCQADWFGRWSEWGVVTAPAKPRTRPPCPVVELGYKAPPAPANNHSNPLSGTLQMVIAVPDNDNLPPGGYSLASLQLEFDDGVDPPSVADYPIVPAGQLPTAPDNHATFYPKDVMVGFDRIEIARTAPGLLRATHRVMQVRGKWQDSSGAMSDFGPAVRVKMVDPRGPLAPTLLYELLYTARPDVTGKARFHFSWTGTSPDARHRVYFTTDTIAMRYLERQLALDPGNQALSAAIGEINDADPGAERATAFRTHSSLLAYGAFESLCHGPIMPGVDSFEHMLSGSFEGLALYKIIAESDHGVVSPFAEASLLTVAVPNLGAPVRPLVSVTRRPPVNNVPQSGVEVRVTVPKGRAPLASWRLRRTITARTDPRQFREVATGQVTNAVDTGRAFELTIIDPYPLRPWTVYQWSVEVQAGEPPGAPNNSPVPVGEWSEPAMPARLTVIPPPPPAPDGVSAQRINNEVEVTIVLHDDTPPLLATERGAYKVELVRRSYKGREAVADAKLVIDPNNPKVLIAIDTAPLVGPGNAPLDTTYAARVVDPVGRASAFTAAAQPV